MNINEARWIEEHQERNEPPRVRNMATLDHETINLMHEHKLPHVRYVGRPRGYGWMHYGNPFTHLRRKELIEVRSRDQACDAYAAWLGSEPRTKLRLVGLTSAQIDRALSGEFARQRSWILDNLGALTNCDLVCWCGPKRCHADHLLTLANPIDAETKR